MSGQTRWSHLRFTATSTSDWATFNIQGIAVRGYNVVSSSPGAVLSPQTDGMSLNGGSIVPGGVSVTWDEILRVPAGSSVALDMQKGNIGRTTLTVTRLDDAGTTTLASLSDSQTQSPNDINQPLTAVQVQGTAGLTWPAATPSHKVFAFYYPWYDSNQGGYSAANLALHPSNPRDTDDAAGVSSMVAQAHAAGVDGFIFSYIGDVNHKIDFSLVAQAEQAVGGTIAPYLETGAALSQAGGNTSTAAQLAQQWLQAAVAQSNPASLRMPDGRLIVFVYQMRNLPVSTWQSFLTNLAAQGTPVAFMGDATGDSTYSSVTVGSHDYGVQNLDSSTLPTYEDDLSADAKVPAVLGTGSARIWASTVSPGYDDRTVASPGTVTARGGGSRYDMTWSAALSADPDWILVTTWNEWQEATAIEPDTTNGTKALDQTTSWTKAFKG